MKRNILESYSQVMVPIEENPDQISKLTKHFYADLYKARPIATTKEIEDHFSIKLTLEEATLCDASLTRKTAGTAENPARLDMPLL